MTRHQIFVGWVFILIVITGFSCSNSNPVLTQPAPTTDLILSNPESTIPDNLIQTEASNSIEPRDGDYPRIANLYGRYDPELGPGFYAGYELYIPHWWRDPAAMADAIRDVSPYTKILHNQHATYGWPESDSLTAEWLNSIPGDPDYNCLMRDINEEILLVEFWGHAMYNMTQSYCRTLLVNNNVHAFLSEQSGQGDSPTYNGIYWDRLSESISWLSPNIDSDLDGQPDNPNTVDAAYQAGVMAFLEGVREQLPQAILLGNDSPQTYARWINGRIYEWRIAGLLNGADGFTWDGVVADYRDWARQGHTPHVTFIHSAPERMYVEKYLPLRSRPMPLAMQEEAAASYSRMRYGLTSALMGDGLFFHDLRLQRDVMWWYDEFGAPANDTVTNLPPPGYLGQPTEEPHLMVDELDTPNQVINGDFEDGLNGWDFWANTSAGAAASIDIDPNGGISDWAGARITVTSVAKPWDVQLYQQNRSTIEGHDYTISFWARSDITTTLHVRLGSDDLPDYVFYVKTTVTPSWQHYHLWDEATMSADDGELIIQLGQEASEIWLDEVQFQPGSLGVWARSFENGLAVINTTRQTQTVPLPGTYRKLNGRQAPLFQIRVDDDEAKASSGWQERGANNDQFGTSVQVAPADTAFTITYTPTLAFAGTYRILAWVVPTITQSSAVSITIQHTNGESTALLDQKVGEDGWHSLGVYTFEAGESGSATLAATGDGIVVADALKWVHTTRYNDGNLVSQIILQPQDGIILLSTH